MIVDRTQTPVDFPDHGANASSSGFPGGILHNGAKAKGLARLEKRLHWLLPKAHHIILEYYPFAATGVRHFSTEAGHVGLGAQQDAGSTGSGLQTSDGARRCTTRVERRRHDPAPTECSNPRSLAVAHRNRWRIGRRGIVDKSTVQ